MIKTGTKMEWLHALIKKLLYQDKILDECMPTLLHNTPFGFEYWDYIKSEWDFKIKKQHQVPEGNILVAIAIFHVTGPLIIISCKPSFIFKKFLLKSKPQPFESRKSTRMCWPISSTDALNTSFSPLRSLVVTVSTLEVKILCIYFIVQNNVSKCWIVSSSLVRTKILVILLTRRCRGVWLACVLCVSCESSSWSAWTGCEKDTCWGSTSLGTSWLLDSLIGASGCEHAKRVAKSSGWRMALGSSLHNRLLECVNGLDW